LTLGVSRAALLHHTVNDIYGSGIDLNVVIDIQEFLEIICKAILDNIQLAYQRIKRQ